jgi:SP family general alpha glucoside:H+ symporter-like MFS transporter
MLSPQGANWGLQSGYLWSGLTLIAGIIVYFQIPETKTRTFAELDELFDRRTSARKFAGTKTTTQETMELQRVDSV